jgi:HEAT repeat protein
MRILLSLAISICLISQFALHAADPANVAKPSVETLIGNLKSEKSDERAQAAAALGELGPLAAPAVTALVKALGDKSLDVQHEALMSLGNIGPAARAAVPELVALLKSPESARLHTGAVDALGAIGRDSMAAAPVLFNLVRGKNPELATSAGLALTRILPHGSDQLTTVIPVLVKSLGSETPEVRNDAVMALGTCGNVAVPALADLVKGHAAKPDLAWQAAAALAMMGPAAKSTVPQLIDALKSGDERVASQAATTLGTIGPEAKDAVPQLRPLVASDSVQVRMHAADALGDIGPAAHAAVPDLAKALRDSHAEMRRVAADALGKIGQASEAAVPALIVALHDDSGAVALHAAGALGQIGPKAVPQLAAAIKDPQRQQLAVMILADMGPAAKPAAKTLAATLDGFEGTLSERDHDFAREIVMTLAHIGPDAREAIPTLMKILTNEKHQVRGGAAWALANIGAKEAVPILKKALETNDESKLHLAAPMALMLLEPGNDEFVRLAVPNLIQLLDHKANLIRREAANTLAMIGPKAAPAVEKLAATLGNPDPAVRTAALAALAAIGPASTGALPEIIQQLTASELPVRYSAIFTIGKIGTSAKQAAPLLEKNLQEHDPFLQTASAWALVYIDPKTEARAAQCLGPLTQGLSIPDPRVRNEIVLALAHLGPAAKPAKKALQNLTGDSDEVVRKSVAEALMKIGN